MANYNERLDETLSTIVDDNKLRPHGRAAPGTCSCGFNAYSVKGMMLDYGDILRAHIDGCMEKVKAYEARVEEAKQALTSLIKELVAEAKPMITPVNVIETYLQNGMTQKAAEYHGRNHAINQFEQNLLKALEEK